MQACWGLRAAGTKQPCPLSLSTCPVRPVTSQPPGAPACWWGREKGITREGSVRRQKCVWMDKQPRGCECAFTSLALHRIIPSVNPTARRHVGDQQPVNRAAAVSSPTHVRSSIAQCGHPRGRLPILENYQYDGYTITENRPQIAYECSYFPHGISGDPDCYNFIVSRRKPAADTEI